MLGIHHGDVLTASTVIKDYATKVPENTAQRQNSTRERAPHKGAERQIEKATKQHSVKRAKCQKRARNNRHIYKRAYDITACYKSRTLKQLRGFLAQSIRYSAICLLSLNYNLDKENSLRFPGYGGLAIDLYETFFTTEINDVSPNRSLSVISFFVCPVESKPFFTVIRVRHMPL